MEKTWKEMKIIYMEKLFGRNAERYEKEIAEDGERDDRQFYINLYRHIMEALETMTEEPHLYVKVALNARIEQDTDMLKEINLRFTGKIY